MKKNFLTLFAFAFLLSCLCVGNVYAECSDCGVSDCESCGCVLNEAKNACIYSNYSKEKISCGEGYVTEIPALLPKTTSIIYIIVQIAVPVVLVVMGTLDLFKGISAQKEDEIKKGQQMFIKRMIAAAIIFFVFVIVKAVISLVADGNSAKIIQCAECFVKNVCDV